MNPRYKFLTIAAVAVLLAAGQYFVIKATDISGVALIVLLVSMSIATAVAVMSLVAAATKNPDKTFDWFVGHLLKGIFGLNP